MRPFFAHEYLNLATDDDPRLAEKYTGAMRPLVSMESFQKELRAAKLSREWGTACLDAGNHLQSVYQKRGLESARLDPLCGGYIYWTIVDVGGGAGSCQGLFDQFWEPKAGTAGFFRQFNGPTALLVKMSPGGQILSDGDALQARWWISHFGGEGIAKRAVDMETGGRARDLGGRLDSCD